MYILQVFLGTSSDYKEDFCIQKKIITNIEVFSRKLLNVYNNSIFFEECFYL